MVKKNEKWEKIFLDIQQSGMREVDYCKANGINSGTFRVMKSRLFGNKKTYTSSTQEKNFHQEIENSGLFTKLSILPDKISSTENYVKKLGQKTGDNIQILNIPIRFETTPNPAWFAQMVLEISKISNASKT